MPRAATNSDVFNAVAEPQRRAILDFLAPGERPVGEVVVALGIAQPSVSKHLRVLSEVDLVRARRDGRRVLYRTNPGAIRPLYDWAGTFERFWGEQLRRIKDHAEATHRGASGRRDSSGDGTKQNRRRHPPPPRTPTKS
jgi:DNA-binding transcriptional ArsR family regulator